MRKSVYIVDDQVGIRLLLKEIISSSGYEVMVFETAKEVLEACEKQTPGLLFVDYNLPLKNGKEIAEQLNQTYGNTLPIIIMSGLSLEEVEDLPSNVKKFLQKPFDVLDITEILTQYLK